MSISNSPLPPFQYHAGLPFPSSLSGGSFYPTFYPAHLSPTAAGTPPASSAPPTSAAAAAAAAASPASSVMTATPVVNMANLMNGMSPMLALATQKDSRWLTLEVCREYQRNKCSRTENECKFAHPPPQVEVQNGRVTACFDSIKGKCQRKDPPCKYLHPPQHLREQLLANGRNNLILKNTAAMLAAQQAAAVSAHVPYHQAAIISAATGMQPQVGGNLLAPGYNPYLSSTHGPTALSLHSALVPHHGHQSSNQPTSGAAPGYAHQQPQGQSDGSTAQHQLVQQPINVIPSPAIVNAQKLQRTDRLEAEGELNPLDAAMAVAQRASEGPLLEPGRPRAIPTTPSTTDSSSAVSSIEVITNAALTAPHRPISAPPASLDAAAPHGWTQQQHELPKTTTTAPLAPVFVGKKRPCDQMSDVINCQGAVAVHAAAFANYSHQQQQLQQQQQQQTVSFSPSNAQHAAAVAAAAAAAANYSQQQQHINNAAVLQATLIGGQHPVLHQQNNMPGLGHPVAKRPALADAKSGVPVYPQPAAPAANSAAYHQAAALAAMQLQQTATSAQQNAFVPVSFTGHPPGVPRF